MLWKGFFNPKNIVGRVLIVSLLAGGLVFAGTFAVNTFVPTSTEASDCCGVSEVGDAVDGTQTETASDVDIAADGNPGKQTGCCAAGKRSNTVTSSCSCGHSNCPSTCSGCSGSDQSCGCHSDCSCPRICKSASYGCDVGPGKCYR